MSDNQKWSILQGDALKVLGTFAPNTFDAVIPTFTPDLVV